MLAVAVVAFAIGALVQTVDFIARLLSRSYDSCRNCAGT